MSVRAALLIAVCAAAACRKADDGAVSSVVALVPWGGSASGCTGPDQVFTPPQVPAQVPLAQVLLAPTSQVAAAGDAELLFISGDAGSVWQIDVSGGAPVETQLVQPGTVQGLLASYGIGAAPVLSGLCVQDGATLLVEDQTSNTILAVDRATPDTVTIFAGAPSTAPGFADGPAQLPTGNCPLGTARFSFSAPAQLVPTGPGGADVYVVDPGNHALRVISGGCVLTVAGTGSPFFLDGSIAVAGFDTPVGLTVRCSGSLLLAETGVAGPPGVDGNRIREVIFGLPNFFGTTGTVSTKVGDGTDATVQGEGEAAQVARPVALLSTSDQDTYWIDSATGILRRMSGGADAVDCPLWPDCASALADFTPGAPASLTQTPGGLLFVLDPAAAGGAGALYRVTP